jgi:hypothetical protein
MRPFVSILTPLSGQPQQNANLLPIWASWYRLDWPKDRLRFVFSVPKAGEEQTRFVEENFKLSHEVLRYEITQSVDDNFHHNRMTELGAMRNLLLSRAKNSDYGWFVDSDVQPPRDAIQRFVADGKDLVGGLVNIPDQDGHFRPGFGYFGPFFQFAKEMPKEPLAKVGAVNTACMFISKRVLNDPKVRFDLTLIPSDEGKEIIFSEDHNFCQTIQQAGYKVWIDTRVRCVHLRMWNGKVRREVVPSIIRLR